MSEEITVINERVDDIPLLLKLFDKMRMSEHLDRHFPTHGHWQGLSLGKVSSVWLSFILSESNHRLSHLQPFAAARLSCLQVLLGETAVRELDFSDDRLADILDILADDIRYQEFSREFNAGLIRTYDLNASTVRVDTTSAKQFVAVSPDGLLQFGHSKEHRPDLPQLKVALSTLDPFGFPLSCAVIPGNRADDGLYQPQIRAVRQTLARSGLTFVGDSKMASLVNRGFIVAGQDYYLCPLARVQMPLDELEQLVERGLAEPTKLTPVFAENATPEDEPLAIGYEYETDQTTQIGEAAISWVERRLVVLSLALQKGQAKSLQERVEKACLKLQNLTERKRGKPVFRSSDELAEAVQKIIKQYKVSGLIEIQLTEQVEEKLVRGYKGEAARRKEIRTVGLSVRINQEKVERAKQMCGWRVYATNQKTDQLPFEKAIQAYRDEYLVERGMRRLKDKPLSLTPVYLHDEERIKGLVRLLTIGLQALVLVEAEVRRKLLTEEENLVGLYPGNKSRATNKPTSEMMLKAFEGITLTLIRDGTEEKRYLNKLTPLQERILHLMGFSSDIYFDLVKHFYKTALNLSET